MLDFRFCYRELARGCGFVGFLELVGGMRCGSFLVFRVFCRGTGGVCVLVWGRAETTIDFGL